MTNKAIVLILCLCLGMSCHGVNIRNRAVNGAKGIEKGPPTTNRLVCDNLQSAQRFDCFPQDGADEAACLARGCCWAPPSSAKNVTTAENAKGQDDKAAPLGVPYCFYPSDYASYKVTSVSNTELGITAILELQFTSPFPRDVQTLQLDAIFETENRLRVKIFDPNNARYETPFPAPVVVDSPAQQRNYDFIIDESVLGFRVIRKSDNTVIFNVQNSGGFIFADQFIQVGALLPSNYIYGIGEHRDNALLPNDWKRYTLFNHDTVPREYTNLYGAHPFYLMMEESGNSHGVFLRNSNAMEVILQPAPAITFRTLGGVLDFYFFLGPSPDEVIQQYTDVIGKPFMPPFWGLGFQLCRYGYNSLENTRAVYERQRAAGIPYDVQWNDIDYMDHHDDFTWDKVNFAGLPEFIDELHSVGMRYIPIMDAAISASRAPGTYPPYDDGVQMDALVKNGDGSVFVGKVWNEISSAYPDFTSPQAVDYYEKQLRIMQNDLRFDGLWIDMNEPSNFLDGGFEGCPDTELENPPYAVSVDGGILRYKTLCMSAVQSAGLHYDVHNLYGATMTEVTNAALKLILNSRPFIISRSTFAGQGKFGGHWSGDISSTWYDMAKTIPELINFSLFGTSVMGADICGFNGNTTPDLCQRWQELGAFYPFSRNHNSIDMVDQDPAALGDAIIASTIKALNIRYSLLPYLYTLLWEAHMTGTTVSRALFFEFPNEAETYSIDTQFLWGSGFMIAPVLEEGAVQRNIYFPAATWYDYYTGNVEVSSTTGTTISGVEAPMDYIPLYVRGGYILPKIVPGLTTTETRNNPFELLVALDTNEVARGNLYWDDGETIDAAENGLYNLITFSVQNSQLTSSVEVSGYESPMPLNKVTVFGAPLGITSVQVNGANAAFTQDASVLTIDGIQGASLLAALTITWT